MVDGLFSFWVLVSIARIWFKLGSEALSHASRRHRRVVKKEEEEEEEDEDEEEEEA
jgi:hypothetical protein